VPEPAAAEIHPSTGVRRGRALLRAGCVALLTLALAACSSIRLGYNNADTLLLYTLDRYFDLDDAQEQVVRERVRVLLAWHRGTQLADYVQLIDAAQRRLDATAAAPLAASDVLALQGQMSERLLAIGRQAAPDLALLARSLSDPQMQRFTERLADENARLRKERAQAARRDVADGPSPARIKRSLERARDWLGPLTPEQEALVRTAAAQRPDGELRWLEERERRQRALVAVLERIRSEQLAPAAGGTLLIAYFDELAQPAGAERRAAVLAAREANAQLIAQLLNSATAAQKATLVKRLRGYAEDFTVLASEGARG
jgi:hypothetical protein